MTRIGNVDQVLLLLREQLQRTGGTRKGARKSTDRTEKTGARPLDRVRALAALETLDEDEVRRAVVRGILTEEFGEDVGNDAALHAITADVVRIIGEMPGGRELLDRAVAQLSGTSS
jgi:hypothetical protein